MLLVRKIAAVILIGLVMLGGALYVASPIEPQPWSPPPTSPQEGAFAPNDQLKAVEWWAKQLIGPEAITVTADGTLYAGLKDGRVVKLHVGSDEPEVLLDTKGRPLAMEFHPDGRLIICDAHRGLLAWTQEKGLETLATSADGVPFKFVDDVVIAKDGTIYFTDASARWSIEHFTEDLLEHQTTGRVLRLDGAGKLTVLADGFNFVNGIALSADERFLAVTETGAYRVWRVPTSGGAKTVLTDALPAFPDNLRRATSRKGFWVALGSPRKPEIDAFANVPLMRKLIAGLPKALMPKAARKAWVLRIDEDGTPLESFRDDSADSYSPIACATEHDGYLYLGSFAREGVARFKLP